MTKNKKTDDVLFDAIKNISKMNENKLYSLSKVLDILPEVSKTENILFFIIGMDEYMLVDLYLLLCSLPENEITQDILLNLSKMDRFILSSLYYLIGKLSFHKITTDVLLNISKITSKDNIYTNMRKNRDVFINVRENIIENIKKDISNIGNNYEEDNEDDKKNRNEYEIICKHMFYALTIVLERLPEEGKTTEILTNISKINNEDTLDKLYNDLKIAINNEEKIQVLNKYGVLQ